MHILFYIGVVIASGLLVARLLGKLKLPNVTGYLIAGLLIGPGVLGILSKETVESLSLFSDVALAFIAYSIGSQIHIKQMKQVGKGILIITVLEALMAMLLVTLVMIFVFKEDVPFALLLGAIACATAPAATLMVIRQYNAKGPVVNTLLPVVALDDCVGIMAFGISVTVAKVLIEGGALHFTNLILVPFAHIVGALVMGFVIGLIYLLILKKIKNESEMMNTVVAVICIGYALSVKFDFSPLLTCMAIGAAVSNFASNSVSSFTIIDGLTTPIFLAFFTISGADLDLSVLKSVGAIGIAYVLVRVAGKWLGSYIGAKISHAESTVQKYLGYTLIPQAGVAIGLSLVAEQLLPGTHGAAVRTVILAGTVIYEFVGPLITKKALMTAGEIDPKNA